MSTSDTQEDIVPVIAELISSLGTTTTDSEENNSCELRKTIRCVGRCDLDIGDVHSHNVMQFKRLNTAVFPVSYSKNFYDEIPTTSDLAKFAYLNDVIVGGLCCRLEMEGNKKQIYIMTLGTLASYRRYGVATMLLNHVFGICKKDTQIKAIYLHVQINNEVALDFYKKFGFNVTGMVEEYYKRIEPHEAYVLEKIIS